MKKPHSSQPEQKSGPQNPPKALAAPATPAPPGVDDRVAIEATSYLHGLFQEFELQKQRYTQLTAQLFTLEARLELAEKNLRLTRDHLAMTIEKTDSALPNNWAAVLGRVRFVGMRLADACAVLLEEKKRMAPKEILLGLNAGMFRFRTNSPLREINAALLRQKAVEKDADVWVWKGTADQKRMRFPVLDVETVQAPDEETQADENAVDQKA